MSAGVPVIRGNNLTTDATKFADDGFVFVTPEKADELGNCDALPGDLVFTAAGTLGQVGLIPKTPKYPRYIISNKQLRARVDTTRVDPRFAFYWFSSPRMVAYIERQNTGSTIPLINLTVLRSLPVPLPPLAEQRRVADILDSLEAKIELDRRVNRSFESIARAIFKSWFVDFDPVRKKMAGGEVGLPPDLAALFPASFDESDLGPVPEAWESGSLGDVAALNSETWSKSTRPDVLQYVDLSNTKWGRIAAHTTYARADAPSRAQRVLRPGDTIVGTVRPGNGSYAHISEDGLTGSTGFAVLRPFEADYREFVYLAATAPHSIASLALLADGAAYPAVRPDAVTATPVALAPHDVMARFSQMAAPLFEGMANRNRESDLLATLRDGLLPRLISGQLTMQGAGSVSS